MPVISSPSRPQHNLAAAALVHALASVAGCSRTPARPHEALAAGVEPLRTQFNQDAGHTRIVMLAAPT